MEVQIVERIGDVDVAAWNALAGDANPFLRHEFLAALEDGGCAVPATGWQPQHLALYDGATLRAAAPLFAKHHSFGEHVFDWAWASAYERAGLRYYPKLVAAVPFSPVTGPRLLLGADADPEAAADALVDAAIELARRRGLSSLHWLFPHAADAERLERRGLLRRSHYQYHWLNPGYRDFDDFLSGFTADKRKKVRRERRLVAEAGIETEVVTGAAIQESHCDALYEFHCRTLRAYGSPLFLSRAFYRALGTTLAERVVMVFARRHGRYVGAALNLRGSDALYGRYWGGEPGISGLHFEVCYYRAIDYCIEQRLARFEGGAGGEHKLARGFVPVPTHSAHWLAHPKFAGAVADFLAREHRGIELEIDELSAHTPFRDPATQAPSRRIPRRRATPFRGEAPSKGGAGPP